MKLIDYCSAHFNMSKRLAKTYIKSGRISVNNNITFTNIDIDPNIDTILSDIQKPDLAYNINEYLIKQADQVVFLYKPPYMHSERHTPEDTLTIEDIFASEYPKLKMITRLDYETDGIIAAIDKSYTANKIIKTYLATVHGHFSKPITMDNIIKASKRKKVHVSQETGEIATLIEPYIKHEKYTTVKITLAKAARHQIRAYLAYLKHPIIGDNLYGFNEDHRLMLHCQSNKINNLEYFSGKEKEFLTIAKLL